MSSDDQMLDNTIGQPGSPDLPPKNGIARKTRADKGVPRVSPITQIVRQFRTLTPEARVTLLEALEALCEEGE